MRPLHIGFLVVGAALAGGLAVKMTQPVAMPAASAPAPVMQAPAPQQQPEAIPQPAKPSPMPVLPPVLAPPPEYAIRKNKPILLPTPAPQQVARVEPVLPKPFPPPTPYNPPLSQPQPQAVAKPAPAPVATQPRHVTVPSGTAIAIRINEPISSDHSAGGDRFSASLADPLVVDGLVIAERGAPVSGLVVNAERAGQFNDTSSVVLGLGTITTADGQHITLATDRWSKRGAAEARDKPVTVSSETIIRFRLTAPVTITERR